MARKRKNNNSTNKGGGGKQNSNNHQGENNQRRASTRKKKKNYRNGNNYQSGVDDYKLRESVERDGMSIIDMHSDGNCLFRSLSDQLFGDYGEDHETVRSEICDFMERNKEDFEIFLVFQDEGDPNTEEDAADFESYISTMRQDGEWGGNLELVAAARRYRRKITVYSATLAAFTIDHDESNLSGPDLLFSYHDNNHYNSVRDEKKKKKNTNNNNNNKTNNKNTKQETSQKPAKNDTKSTAAATTTNYPTTEQGNGKNNSSTTISTKVSDKSELSANDGGKGGGRKVVVKKNAPCPCESGLKYKKCCLAKQKSQKRLERLQGMNQSNNDDDSDNNDEDDDYDHEEINGAFRVLKI